MNNQHQWIQLPPRNVFVLIVVIMVILSLQSSADDMDTLFIEYGDSVFYNYIDSVVVTTDTTTLFFINIHKGLTVRRQDAYLDSIVWTETMQPYIDMCYLVRIDTVRYFSFVGSDTLMYYNQYLESIDRPDNIIYEYEGVIGYE